jgi:hypothetical protein
VNLKARLKTLEKHKHQVLKEPFRIIFSHVGEPLDLTKATCSRTIWPSGHLFEVVSLNGSDDDLSEEDLENFVQSFPIEYRSHGESHRKAPSHASIGKAKYEPKEQT